LQKLNVLWSSLVGTLEGRRSCWGAHADEFIGYKKRVGLLNKEDRLGLWPASNEKKIF
jgi:hypothetical protein